MILRILGALVAGIVVLVIIFWFITGGPSKVVSGAKAQPDIISSILSANLASKIFSIKLPWQEYTPNLSGSDISQYIGSNTQDANGSAYSQEQLDQAKAFGMPSPYRSQVTLQETGATQSDPAREYLTITSAKENTGTISLTGWSVQSAVSGQRFYLPEASSVFLGGAVNNVGHVMLAPGGTAIIASGVSPVGVSFRENVCSGYLGKLQSFHPSLGYASCPNPSNALPETVDNLRAYGSACLDYVRNLSSCEFPQDMPSTLSSACRTFISNTFSYNGCLRMYRDTPSFLRNSWRLYLNSQTNIWDNAHDIIRLLDEQGRTVDAVTY